MPKAKAPEEADSRKRDRSPKSGQSSNRSWEKVELKGSAWDVRLGHPMEKNGVWGPFGKVKAFRISELPAHVENEKGAGSGGKDERVSCPVCWAVKPRNTLWLHLSNSASCGSWQEKLLGLSDGTKQEKCRFCSKAFYRESDRLQHERNCTAQPVAEPASPPRRKVEKESTSKHKALRMDSRERMMEKDRGRYESRGRSRRNRRASSAPEPVRPGCDPGSGPGITASAVLAAQEAQARLLELRAQGQALMRYCQACIQRQQCQNHFLCSSIVVLHIKQVA